MNKKRQNSVLFPLLVTSENSKTTNKRKSAVLVSVFMEFFTTSISGLETVVTALGAGVAVWGVINLLEGYGGDNPASKSQGAKQLMAGGGIIVIAQTVIPNLTSLF